MDNHELQLQKSGKYSDRTKHCSRRGEGAQHVLGIEPEFLPLSALEKSFKGNTRVTFIGKGRRTTF